MLINVVGMNIGCTCCLLRRSGAKSYSERSYLGKITLRGRQTHVTQGEDLISLVKKILLRGNQC
jgi:hypothetical protein